MIIINIKINQEKELDIKNNKKKINNTLYIKYSKEKKRNLNSFFFYYNF